MMFDILGKTLVAVCTALSVVFFGIALAIFAFPADPGWRVPRIEWGQRIPSEFDQRAAAVQKLQNARAVAENDLKQAQVRHNHARVTYFTSHTFGERKLEELANSPNPKLLVQRVFIDKGTVPFDPNYGVPFFKGDVVFQYTEGKDTKTVKVSKSLKEYRKELEKLDQEIVAATEELKKEYARQQEITEKIGGKIETGKKVVVGLYDLIESEAALQNQLRRSLEDIRPRWVWHLVEVQLLAERREQMEQRLKELRTKTAQGGN